MKSKLNKDLKIDKNSIQYLKYKDIAIEFIKQGYNNIRGIYSKYYPNAAENSLDTEPYRLLDNVRFQAALEEAWQEIKVEDLDIAKEVVLVLRDKMLNAKKENDRIAAAVALGKFTIGEKFEGKIDNKITQNEEYTNLRQGIFEFPTLSLS